MTCTSKMSTYMRKQSQDLAFKDLIPSSAMVPSRLCLVIIADIGKGLLPLTCWPLYVIAASNPTCFVTVAIRYVVLAPQPGHDTLFGW